MRRIGNMYDKVCEPDNLRLAYTKARRGKARQYGVRIFDKDVDGNLEQIHRGLVAGTYVTSEYSVFTIREPKERVIYRLPFRDRVVQHAVMNILEDVWTSIFIEQTYSCIKGRGIHGVVRHIKRDLRDEQNTKYCLKLDIRKFYPSIDHQIAKQIIRRKIKDQKLLCLLDGIIDSAPGLPIGNYLSQFIANLYLSYFDHYLKEERRVKYYYRYADDIVILSGDKAYLHGLLVDINDYLSDRLHLQLKGNYQVFPVEARGVDFVGYVFYHNHILMRKSIKQNLCRKAARLNKRAVPSIEYRKSIAPWLGWAKHCNSRHLLKTVLRYEEVR